MTENTSTTETLVTDNTSVTQTLLTRNTSITETLVTDITSVTQTLVTETTFQLHKLSQQQRFSCTNSCADNMPVARSLFWLQHFFFSFFQRKSPLHYIKFLTFWVNKVFRNYNYQGKETKKENILTCSRMFFFLNFISHKLQISINKKLFVQNLWKTWSSSSTH